MKKIELARELINDNINLFSCPICQEKMYINELGSLKCIKNHNFDISKKGYVNLLTTKATQSYSKSLFEARKKASELGFFNPLIEKIVEAINNYHKNQVSILDAGCGEASHIYGIKELLQNNNNTYIGIDISKDGIHIASQNKGIILCVADLAKLPFQDKSFDIILNILSPANYLEFIRVLNDKGIIIKVVPKSHYLIELRNLLRNNDNEYSNIDVINNFKQKLDVIDIQSLTYTFSVSSETLPYFLKMTPLTWRLDDKLVKNISSLTVDLMIIVGKSKKHPQ